MLHTAAALLALRFVPLVGEKMFEGSQQEGAELAAFRAETFEVVAFEETGEERLCEIFRVLPSVTAPSHIGVKRIPIELAKFAQGMVRLRRRFAASRQHDRPASGDENFAGRM